MPTPRRTSAAAIVEAGRRILEADGLENLTMHQVALAVGVRAPSLYEHVRGRGDLVHLIANDTVTELGHRLDEATGSGDAVQDLAAMVVAHRRFAHEHPQAYRLVFDRMPGGWGPDLDRTVNASAAFLRTVAELTDGDHALEAARTVVAWAHGFVSMELSGSFRLGGDPDAAFAFGIERLTRAVARDGR